MGWFRRNSEKTKKVGEARFTGEKKKLKKGCTLPKKIASKLLGKVGLIYIGELRELECESPEDPKFNAYHLIKSKKRPKVVATEKGECVLIISSDKVKKIKEEKVSEDKVSDAAELHEAFHGTEPSPGPEGGRFLGIDIDIPKKLIFVGHLNFIVYSVPFYSERRGTPFIHTAKDRGDNIPPAKEKPVVCISPNKDFIIMYGPQFEFTERGIIG